MNWSSIANCSDGCDCPTIGTYCECCRCIGQPLLLDSIENIFLAVPSLPCHELAHSIMAAFPIHSHTLSCRRMPWLISSLVSMSWLIINFCRVLAVYFCLI